MSTPNVSILLLAGGSGSRMGADQPKQLLPLKGRPILAHSLTTFLTWPRTARLCLVSRGDLQNEARKIVEDTVAEMPAAPPVDFADGGDTRHASTLAGINCLRPALRADDLLFIHDAARPLIDHAELDRLAHAFDDAAVTLASLVARITDTIVAADGLPGVMKEKLDRDRLFAVKTPQALRASALARLVAIPERAEFTDLLTWGAAAGLKGTLVEAGPLNHKVTTDRDLRFLEGV